MSSRWFRARRWCNTSNARSLIEPLEGRLLLSATESASAQLQLLPATGATATPVHNYGITLADTGSTNVGTFWFSWEPGEGFLPSSPTHIGSPAGWTAQITDGPGGPGANGFSIQWVAQSTGAELTAGNSLSGFLFSSTDSPATMDGTSLGHAPTPVLESTIYSGAPFSDAGDEFTVTGVPVVNTPALTSTIAKSTLPASIVSGVKTNAVVSVDVSNQTAAAIKGKTRLKLFASTDGAIDGSSTLVGSLTRNLTIGAKRSTVVSVKTSSALAGLSAGTYTLLVETIDPSAHTTDSSTGPGVQVAAPVVALSESFSKLTLPTTLAAGAKTHAVAALTVANGGNIEAAGPAKISFFASADGLVDGTATLIQSFTKTLHIAPRKSATISLPLTKFPAVASGDYFIVAQVTDPKRNTTSEVAASKVTVS